MLWALDFSRVGFSLNPRPVSVLLLLLLAVVESRVSKFEVVVIGFGLRTQTGGSPNPKP